MQGNNPTLNDAARQYSPFNCLQVPVFQNAVNEVQINIKAPTDLIVMCALSAVSVAAQRLIKVRLPVIGPVPTSLMMMIIANSGERKSTVEGRFFAGIRDFEKELNNQVEADQKSWKIEYEVWKTRVSSYKKKVDACIRNDESPEAAEAALKEQLSREPKRPDYIRFLYQDATSAALFRNLAESFPSAGLVSGEGGTVLGSDAFNDMAKMNALWSGESILIERATKESIRLTDAQLTVSIMVQPEVLKKYVENRGELARGSGLMARFLFSSGFSTQGDRPLNHLQTPIWSATAKFRERIVELMRKTAGSAHAPGFEPEILSFDTQAEARWAQYFNDVEWNIRPGFFYADAGDHASKLSENVARVAALLHYFEGVEGPISLPTLEAAITICGWSSTCFNQYFNGPPQEELDADILLEWLHKTGRKKNTSVFRQNYILKYGPLRIASRLQAAIDILCARCVITVNSDQNNANYVYFTSLPQMPLGML